MIKNKKLKTKNQKLVFPSEFRQDPLSQDWVLIATGRARRPEEFKKERKEKYIPPKKKCPFCRIAQQEEPILISVKGEKFRGRTIPQNWTTVVVPNKYPALLPSLKLREKKEWLYQIKEGVGHHEVVVTKDHIKSMGKFSKAEIKEVIDVYQERYLDLMNEAFINYVSIFHNHGAEAGASIFHPHSQIIALPIIDPDLNKSVLKAKNHFQTHKKCIYCQMNNFEKQKKERIVFENEEFLAVCPFVSKAAFEMIISPKKHLPYFERITHEQKKYLAEVFQVVLGKLYKGLDNPPYNFYLHTAPCDGKNYNFYHWHFTILPKTAIWAGFEFCTGIEICTITPEEAAKYLRKQ